jgi:hypothetical protein
MMAYAWMCVPPCLQFARAGGAVSWEQLEREEIGGQRLQGTHVARKVAQMLRSSKVGACA